jgi:hypothetical protein
VADWLFVIGISCEISGAFLVAGDFIFAKAWEIAARDMTFPSSGQPRRESQRGAAFAIVGVTLIATGFLLQLIGYIVQAHDKWFILVAAAVVIVTFSLGWWLARGLIMDTLHGRTVGSWDDMQKDALAAQRDDRSA